MTALDSKWAVKTSHFDPRLFCGASEFLPTGGRAGLHGQLSGGERDLCGSGEKRNRHRLSVWSWKRGPKRTWILGQSARSALLTVVIFRLGREWYAFPATAFQEVADHRRLHALPRRKGGWSSPSAGMSKLGERGWREGGEGEQRQRGAAARQAGARW